MQYNALIYDITFVPYGVPYVRLSITGTAKGLGLAFRDCI